MSYDAAWCWDAAAGKELARMPIKDAEVLAATPDGKIAVVTSDHGLPIAWEAANGKRRVLRGLIEHGADRAAISEDGRFVAAVQLSPKRVARLWDLTADQHRTPLDLKHSMEKVSSLVFSADDRTLAAVGDRVTIWDIASEKDRTPAGELDRPARGHSVPYLAAAFSPSGRLLATGEESGVVHLWEVASGRQVCAFTGHRQAVTAVTFSADGRTLVSGSADCTAIVWNVNSLGQVSDAAKPVTLEDLTADLAATDAKRAYRAVISLARVPEQALPLLERALERSKLPDDAQIRRLVATLDAETFAERQRATAELQRLGKSIEAALRQVLADEPSLELRRRVESLLAQVDRPAPLSAAFLRGLRALESLEQIGTPQARQVLEKFAGEATDVQLGREAKASLERLGRRTH
jgi:hypothetical protein